MRDQVSEHTMAELAEQAQKLGMGYEWCIRSSQLFTTPVFFIQLVFATSSCGWVFPDGSGSDGGPRFQ
jgi:hypothetical protein